MPIPTHTKAVLIAVSSQDSIQRIIHSVHGQNITSYFATTALEACSLLKQHKFNAVVCDDDLEDDPLAMDAVSSTMAEVAKECPDLKTLIIDKTTPSKRYASVSKRLKGAPHIAIVVASQTRIAELNFELL